MKSLKNTITTVLLTLFLSLFSLNALADRNSEAVEKITTHINAAIQSIDAENSTEALEHIKQAKRAKKELNSEQNAASIGRLSAHFNKAKKMVKKSDYAGAKAELETAKSGYNALDL